MKFLITILVVITMSTSCTTRQERQARYDRKPVKKYANGSSKLSLTLETIDGHEYVLFDRGSFGNTMVHHAGCDGEHKVNNVQ